MKIVDTIGELADRAYRPIAKLTEKPFWTTGYADFGGKVGKVYDYQVGDYARKHMRIIDRFSFRKIAYAMSYSFSILSQSIEEPKPGKDNWKFIRDV